MERCGSTILKELFGLESKTDHNRGTRLAIPDQLIGNGGIGVRHFKEEPKANKFINDKQLLTGSEWSNALKLNINYAPLRGVPGVGGNVTGNVGTLCRRCGRETETVAHVLGKCPYNMLLITRRHHNVKHWISEKLRERDYDCLEEVFSIDADGSTRFADILAFSKKDKKALVIDPTVRYETNDPNQAEKVDIEKKGIYEKCIPFFKEKFREEFGEREYRVMGLWFGARGTLPRLTVDFAREMGFYSTGLHNLAESIILDSLGILHHHIYGA
ncbi:uncharacterized protein [Rhodnius prolixus]|uniref:uncharacterized protein n=1 Tax=Rhodnius prolixus TaxID=13249 RepID=UPI003D18D135